MTTATGAMDDFRAHTPYLLSVDVGHGCRKVLHMCTRGIIMAIYICSAVEVQFLPSVC